jgi:hypothetical protein
MRLILKPSSKLASRHQGGAVENTAAHTDSKDGG